MYNIYVFSKYHLKKNVEEVAREMEKTLEETKKLKSVCIINFWFDTQENKENQSETVLLHRKRGIK